jgi:hypothetical protein
MLLISLLFFILLMGGSSPVFSAGAKADFSQDDIVYQPKPKLELNTQQAKGLTTALAKLGKKSG